MELHFLYLKPKIKKIGELAEWLNAAVLKTVKDASPSGVRIPDSPQSPFVYNRLGTFQIISTKNN